MPNLEGSEISKIVTQDMERHQAQRDLLRKKTREEMSWNIYKNDLSKHLGDDVKAKLTLITGESEFIVITGKKLRELAKGVKGGD